MVEVVSEEYAVDDFVGFRVADRQHDVLDQAPVARGVDSVDFGGYVVPVVGDRFDAPSFAAEDEYAIISKLINIYFLAKSVEANWLVSRGNQIKPDIGSQSP
ncbi:hypothetical protein PPUN15366_04050 [Pseudomonas putida]|nr:hypothetical protein PPUN15366_04050 [Pseudomonas putida]